MKYDFDQALMHLDSIGSFLYRKGDDSSERINSSEFSLLCRDVIQSLNAGQKGSKGDFGMTLSRDQIVTGHNDHSNQLLRNYFLAVGVVAASTDIPEQKKALEYVAGFAGDKDLYRALSVMQDGYGMKFRASDYSKYPTHPCPYGEGFSKAVEGFTLLAGPHFFHEASVNVLVSEVGPISNFLEKLEKTRNVSPQWKDSAELIRYRYSNVIDLIGRKNEHLSKIFRLVNDGAASVSINDCVSATKDIVESLSNPDLAKKIDFSAALDVLDEHPDFWKVAFQDEILSKTQKYSFIDDVLPRFDEDERKLFQSNLIELNSRIQDKVTDPSVLMSSLITGKSITNSLIAKDRSQGDPRWMENSILDDAIDIRNLARRGSSLSIVIDGLLERIGKPATEEFWAARERNGYLPVRERLQKRDIEEESGMAP